MGTEIWRTPIGKGEIYNNYQVSNFGQILSLNYGRTGKPKLLKPEENKRGYLRIVLCKDGKPKRFLIHRLVSETFLPNPDNLSQVNHKDENKTNNFVGTPENDYKDGNLEWCTPKENCNYGTRTKRVAKAKSKSVIQLTLDGEFVREWESAKEAEKNGFSQGNICKCCNGKLKSAYGFLWRYK